MMKQSLAEALEENRKRSRYLDLNKMNLQDFPLDTLTGSSEELPALLDLLTGSSEYIPDVPYTTNAPVRREFYPQETAHSAIDSLIVNNQRPDVRNFPGGEVGNWLLGMLQLTLGSGMPIENPAKYKKP